jgi:hypothetical protein
VKEQRTLFSSIVGLSKEQCKSEITFSVVGALAKFEHRSCLAAASKYAASVRSVRHARGLTLPSSRHPKSYAFCMLLMSHVRPRLEVTAIQPVQRFCWSAFAESSSPEKKFLVFASFGGRARQWLRRQSFSARSSASWPFGSPFQTACSAFLFACFCTPGGSEPQVLKSPKRLLLWRS